MAIQEAPHKAAQEINPSGEQWKPEKEAREIALEAFHRQLSAFNTIPDSKLTKWELAERNTINELLASKGIDFSEEKDTFVDENGIRKGVPFQAFINNVASRALTDRQAEKDRNILERYSRSPISGIRGDGEKSSRVHSQLTESAKKGVRTRAEAAKRAQTGIRDFRPPPAANEKAPWGRIKKIKGASVKTPSPEWLLNAVVENPAISGEVQRPKRASAWETRPSVKKIFRDDRNKSIFTQTEPTAPEPKKPTVETPKLDVNYAHGHSPIPISKNEHPLGKFGVWPRVVIPLFKNPYLDGHSPTPISEKEKPLGKFESWPKPIEVFEVPDNQRGQSNLQFKSVQSTESSRERTSNPALSRSPLRETSSTSTPSAQSPEPSAPLAPSVTLEELRRLLVKSEYLMDNDPFSYIFRVENITPTNGEFNLILKQLVNGETKNVKLSDFLNHYSGWKPAPEKTPKPKGEPDKRGGFRKITDNIRKKILKIFNWIRRHVRF